MLELIADSTLHNVSSRFSSCITQDSVCKTNDTGSILNVQSPKINFLYPLAMVEFQIIFDLNQCGFPDRLDSLTFVGHELSGIRKIYQAV